MEHLTAKYIEEQIKALGYGEVDTVIAEINKRAAGSSESYAYAAGALSVVARTYHRLLIRALECAKKGGE